MRKAFTVIFLLSSVLLIAAIVTGCSDSGTITPAANAQFAFLRNTSTDLTSMAVAPASPAVSRQRSESQIAAFKSRVAANPAVSAAEIVDGPIDVYTMFNNGKTGSEVRVAQGTSVISVHMSADGKKAALTGIDSNQHLQVYAVNDMANPSNLVQLTTDNADHAYAQISPDGTKVVYITFLTWQAYVVNSDGSTTNASRLAIPGVDYIYGATFISSGQLVIETYTEGRGNGLYSVNVDASGLTQLTTSPYDANPSVSADGKKIVFDRYDSGTQKVNIWIMDSNGQNAKQLTTTGSRYYFDPLFVGDKIVFYGDLDNDQDMDIYSMNLDGTAVTPLTDTPESDFFDWLVFTAG